MTMPQWYIDLMHDARIIAAEAMLIQGSYEDAITLFDPHEPVEALAIRILQEQQDKSEG